MTSTLFAGGHIWAGTRPEPRWGWLLTRDGTVAEVGHGEAPAEADEVIDLAGRHLLPGFTDVHSHLGIAAWQHVCPDGIGWTNAHDALAAVRRAAQVVPEGQWIVGFRVDHATWRSPPPSAETLQEAAGDHPALLCDLSLHRGHLSARGFDRTGLARPGGARASDIDRSRHGPTGLVWEEAFSTSLAEALRSLAAGESFDVEALYEIEARRHLALGIVRAHDPGVDRETHARLLELSRRTPLRLSWSVTGEAGLLTPPGDPSAHLEDFAGSPPSVKLFTDGARRCAVRLPVPSLLRTAGAEAARALRRRDLRSLADVGGNPVHRHGPVVEVDHRRRTDDELISAVASYAEAEFRLRVHALGNLAVEQAVRALDAARAGGGSAIEHAVVLSSPEVDLVAGSGATVSLQPGFLPHYGDMLRAVARAPSFGVVPVQTLRRAGVPLVLSSDHPCAPLDPLHNIRRAIDRQVAPGRPPLQLEEAIDVAAAVAAYTGDPARLLGDGPGVLVAGGPADLVVLTGHPASEGSRVASTWVDGRRVHPSG